MKGCHVSFQTVSSRISHQQSSADTNVPSQPEQIQGATSRAGAGLGAPKNLVQRERLQCRRGQNQSSSADLYVLIQTLFTCLCGTFLASFLCLQFSFLSSFRPQVKNVYQTSFSAFLESLDLSRATEFPQVRVDPHSTCPTNGLAHMIFTLVRWKSSCNYCLLMQICPWKYLFLPWYCCGKGQVVRTICGRTSLR